MWNNQKATMIDYYAARPRVEHNKTTIFQTAAEFVSLKKMRLILSYFYSNGSFRGWNFEVKA